jgi:hypothetical protein
MNNRVEQVVVERFVIEERLAALERRLAQVETSLEIHVEELRCLDDGLAEDHEALYVGIARLQRHVKDLEAARPSRSGEL